MPSKFLYGLPISPASLAAQLEPAMPVTATTLAPIQIRKWVRNGKAPNVELANRINEAANFAVLMRSKEVFSAFANPQNAANGGMSYTTMWRFAFHTGPYTHAIIGTAAMLNPYNSGSKQATATLNVYSDTAETTLVGSAVFYYGPSTGTGGFGWRQARYPSAWVSGLSPDTDYYARWDLSNTPYVTGAVVCDMQSLTEHNSGYLTQSLTMHTPILGTDRSLAAGLLKNVWKRGGSKVLNYCVMPGNHSVGQDATETNSISNTTTSATLTNILDRASTTISAATPGWTIDMRNKDRVGQPNGVPCVMKVFGRGSVGLIGTVVLKNSAGTTIATAGPFGGTNGWFSVAFNMPAVLDKYDIQFNSDGVNRVYLYAVTIYEFET